MLKNGDPLGTSCISLSRVGDALPEADGLCVEVEGLDHIPVLPHGTASEDGLSWAEPDGPVGDVSSDPMRSSQPRDVHIFRSEIICGQRTSRSCGLSVRHFDRRFTPNVIGRLPPRRLYECRTKRRLWAFLSGRHGGRHAVVSKPVGTSLRRPDISQTHPATVRTGARKSTCCSGTALLESVETTRQAQEMLARDLSLIWET